MRKLEKFYYSSPLGMMVLCGCKSELCGLWFVGQQHFPNGVEDLDVAGVDCAFVVQTIRWLDAYFSHQELPELPNFFLEGTAFRQAVWSALGLLPYGTQVTYTDIAEKVSEMMGGTPIAVRAVASAIGRNPISILIPCHRVLGKDGSLRGYAGGLDRKQWLLEWERNKDKEAL